MELATTTTRRWMALLLVTAVALLGAACGDDDDAANDATSEDASAGEDTGEGDEGGECADTDLVAESLATGQTVDITSTAGAAPDDGLFYYAYLADFDVSGSAGSLFEPDVPADGNLFTVNVVTFGDADTVREPIAAGQVAEFSRDNDVLTMRVLHTSGAEAFNMLDADTASGTVTVTSVGDEFCGEIDYTDEHVSISGTFRAPTS